jgi:pimeloyl-ACP methyl ester carboxylesterase
VAAPPSRWKRSWLRPTPSLPTTRAPRLAEIAVPTLITHGARDLVCSTRFAEPIKSGIAASELVVFDHLSHAGLHEDPETFNRATLDFLLRQRS